MISRLLQTRLNNVVKHGKEKQANLNLVYYATNHPATTDQKYLKNIICAYYQFKMELI